MKRYKEDWTLAESPLLWVETIFWGDILWMKKYLGFSYGGHYFTNSDQNVTFYQNLDTEKKAGVYGDKKYREKCFISFFCKKSKEFERRLSKICDNINKSDLSNENNKEITKIFNNFFDAYSIVLGFYRFSRYDMYNKIIEDMKKKLPEPKEENMLKLLEGKLKGLNLDDKSKQLAKSLRDIGKRRFDMHKEWEKAYRDAQILFEEIGRRIDLSSLQVQNMTSKELIDALNGKKPDIEEINKRIKEYRFNYYDSFFTVDHMKNKAIEGVKNEIKGTIAFRGKARGNVTLLTESLKGTDIKAMNAMPKGNILVTVMTSPDMMLAIEKAAAIVTDEGGMLCHAAIVSREFKIPCIVGTGNATKVLKEGDYIEVDAEKGTVRKIRR